MCIGKSAENKTKQKKVAAAIKSYSSFREGGRGGARGAMAPPIILPRPAMKVVEVVNNL